MYSVEVHTAAASAPVTAAELRAWLRLNDSAEDATLTELLAAAVERFEDDTRRPVLPTVYRQYLDRWPVGCEIVLGRGGVTAVASVSRYLADGTTTEAVTGYLANLRTPPARVVLAGLPAEVETAAGVAVRPVGFVQFSAGWANAAAVPRAVLVALKSLAGHWYENREAFTERDLGPTAEGWGRVVTGHRLGLSGDWGQ